MSATSWNDAEDEALQGLTLEAQLMYLRGIRRYMNYQTGIADFISMRTLKTCIEYLPCVGSKLPARRVADISDHFVRAKIAELQRSGLIAKIEKNSKNKFEAMAFKCCFASLALIRPKEEPQGNRKRATDRGTASDVFVDSITCDTGAAKGAANEGRRGTATYRDTGNTQSISRAIPHDFKVTQQHRDYARMHNLPDPDEHVLLFIEVFSENKKISQDWNGEFRKFLIRAKVFAKERKSETDKKSFRSPAQILADGCSSAFESGDEEKTKAG